MALSQIYGKRVPLQFKAEENTEAVLLELDLTIEESHHYSNTVTQYNVENGAFISDHIRNVPDELSVSGVVTNSPVIVLQPSDTDQFTVDNINIDDRAQNAYNVLRTLHEKRVPFTIVTGFRVYNNMFFTSLDVVKNFNTGDSYNFSGRLREIRTVKSDLVEITVAREETTKNRVNPNVDKGNATPKEAKEETETKVSALKALFNLATGN